MKVEADYKIKLIIGWKHGNVRKILTDWRVGLFVVDMVVFCTVLNHPHLYIPLSKEKKGYHCILINSHSTPIYYEYKV